MGDFRDDVASALASAVPMTPRISLRGLSRDCEETELVADQGWSEQTTTASRTAAKEIGGTAVFLCTAVALTEPGRFHGIIGFGHASDGGELAKAMPRKVNGSHA